MAKSTGSVVVAIDQGTTNTKVVAVNQAGQIIARHSERVAIGFPRPAWVQSDAADIWGSVGRSVHAVLAQLGDDVSVAALGIANQRESVTAWDPQTGEVLGPVVSWQCTRGAPLCASLGTPQRRELVGRLTGLALDPMFSASKMRWLLDNISDGRQRAADGRLLIGTIDTWLLWNLTGGATLATDLTNASRTALCDVASGDWSQSLLDMFDIPRAALATIRPSASNYGEADLGDKRVPIGALIGDSHAALVGHGAFEPGAFKASFGTGTSVMAPVADARQRPAGLAMTIGWSAGAPATARVVHALEGNIYATGAALEWTANLLGVGIDELEDLALGCTDAAEVALVPAFCGLGAPHWDPTARGTISGLTRGAGREHLARATFESIGHQVADVVDAIRPALGDSAPSVLHADGGASAQRPARASRRRPHRTYVAALR